VLFDEIVFWRRRLIVFWGGGWGELLIDGGDGFHDAFKDYLLVFEFGSEGGKLIKSKFD
jgi:hypothetical protein